MSLTFLRYLGIGLMAACGSVLSRRLGLAGADAALFAGFAGGIILIALASTAELRKRVEVLEEKAAGVSKLPGG